MAGNLCEKPESRLKMSAVFRTELSIYIQKRHLFGVSFLYILDLSKHCFREKRSFLGSSETYERSGYKKCNLIL